MRLIDADAFKKILSEHEMKHDKRRSFDDYAWGASNAYEHASDLLDEMPTVERPQWIPCSERLPEDTRHVIVTWKNTDPASYYQYIVGKHFTGTACYKNGKWYWYSSTTEDMLAEYGRYDSEEFDEAIECIAWMPLPEPYKEEEIPKTHSTKLDCVGFSQHDCESHYRCPFCGEHYGSYSIPIGKPFKCKCGRYVWTD